MPQGYLHNDCWKTTIKIAGTLGQNSYTLRLQLHGQFCTSLAITKLSILVYEVRVRAISATNVLLTKVQLILTAGASVCYLWAFCSEECKKNL